MKSRSIFHHPLNVLHNFPTDLYQPFKHHRVTENLLFLSFPIQQQKRAFNVINFDFIAQILSRKPGKIFRKHFFFLINLIQMKRKLKQTFLFQFN
jgi:hypothetical protein